MKVRHEARLIGESRDEVFIRLDAIDRGQPQPFEIWRRAQDRRHKLAQRRGCRRGHAP